MTNPLPRSLTVLRAQRVSPSMHQITLGGKGMRGFPVDQAGGYVKLMLSSGKILGKPIMRTYTIHDQRAPVGGDFGEIDIQFALHGGNAAGPATSWALSAKEGDTIRLGGPGPAKPFASDRDHLMVAGDMSALPAIAANLRSLPDTAKGIAMIEIQHEEDAVELAAPDGIAIEWIVNDQPGLRPELLSDALRAAQRPNGSVYAWVACEFAGMRACRAFLRDEMGLGPRDLYISSYWKHGFDEGQHKKIKRQDAQSAPAVQTA
ncbi:MAG: siderophore-interacting protein [Erythrobacter sp.]